jgi:uncharacterized membrane protein YeaQ/YmgE (transglycosylase-associated protein family)
MPVLLILLLAVIVLFVIGGFVIGFALKLLWLVLVGLVIGALGRLVLPGIQAIGMVGTILAGIGGALLGGIVGDAIDVGGFVTFLIAIAVAAGLIAALGSTQRAVTA